MSGGLGPEALLGALRLPFRTAAPFILFVSGSLQVSVGPASIFSSGTLAPYDSICF